MNMVLTALKDIFVRVEYDDDQSLAWLFVGESIPFHPIHEVGGAVVLHLKTGNQLRFTSVKRGNDPYSLLADAHPDLLKIEEAE